MWKRKKHDDLSWAANIKWPDECQICGVKMEDPARHKKWHKDRGEG